MKDWKQKTRGAVIAAVMLLGFAAQAEDPCPHWTTVMPLAAGIEEDLIRDVIDLGETTFIDGVLYCWTLHPRGNPAVDIAADYAARYRVVSEGVRKGSKVKQGILLQSTMGHGGSPSEPTRWQLTVKPDGTSVYRMCPLDGRFRDYIAKACRTVSDQKPDFYMVDDDARIQFDHNIPGCYCPLHLAEFSRRTGRTWTREELVEEIRKGKGEVFDAWLALGTETMVDFYGLIRKNISSEIPGILCCTSFRHHNRHALTFAKILAASGQKPAIRGYGAPYHDHGRIDHLPLVRASFAAQRERIGEDVVFMQEGDTCPHTLWSTGATRAVDHLVMLALDGMKGAKIWITRTSFYREKRSTDMYRKAFRKYRGLMTWAANVDLCETGVVLPPIDKRGAIEFGGYYFARTGIPCRYGKARPDEVTALTADVLRELSREEIAAILSGRVLLDASAAEWLSENGFSEDIGVRAKAWTGAQLTSQEFADGRIAYGGLPQVRKKGDVGVADLNDRLPGAEVLSRLMSQTAPSVPPKYEAPGSLLFTNARGGRVLTLALAVPRQDPAYFAQQMLTETYKDEVVNALVRLGGGLPGGAVYRGDGPFICLTGKTAEGEDILVLDPTDFDGADEPEFLMDRLPDSIERLGDDGVWRKADFRKTGERSVAIASPVLPQHPAIFRLKE